MQPNLVELWALESPRFLGLILALPTGVVYTNQAGGLRCEHPRLEGAYVPIAHPYWNASTETCLAHEWWPASDVERVHTLVGSFLVSARLDNLFEPGLNVLLGKEFGEAWAPVRVKPNNEPALRAFAGKEGVITYANSD